MMIVSLFGTERRVVTRDDNDSYLSMILPNKCLRATARPASSRLRVGVGLKTRNSHVTPYNLLKSRIVSRLQLRGGAGIGESTNTNPEEDDSLNAMSNKQAVARLVALCEKAGVPPPSSDIKALRILLKSRGKGRWNVYHALGLVAREEGINLQEQQVASDNHFPPTINVGDTPAVSGAKVELGQNASCLSSSSSSSSSLIANTSRQASGVDDKLAKKYFVAPPNASPADLADFMCRICRELGIEIPDTNVEARAKCGSALLATRKEANLTNINESNNYISGEVVDIFAALCLLAKERAEQAGMSAESFVRDAAQRAEAVRMRVREAEREMIAQAARQASLLASKEVVPRLDEHQSIEGFLSKLNQQQRRLMLSYVVTTMGKDEYKEGEEGEEKPNRENREGGRR
eukprot:jgi/Bigna1/138294/aug1.44_g13002